MQHNNTNKNYSHALPEALFPLFKSDKEYELINSVLIERFPEKKKIMIMYKYLASRHFPKFVLFSGTLPYGIVIKRLLPEQAWNEVYCNKILTKVHNFDFDVIYHQSLGCISEKYLPGFDVLNLPSIFLTKNKYIKLIFYWLGKCSCVAYVLGIGDRGHNERMHCREIEDLYQLFSLTKNSEPILNIDFEEFPSKRLFNSTIDKDEIALAFYSLIIQLPEEYFDDYDNLFIAFQKGFEDKLNNIRSLWKHNNVFFNDMLKCLFIATSRENVKAIIANINERATGVKNFSIFNNVDIQIEKAIKKFKIFKEKEKKKALLKEKRRLLHYYKEE
ncbi:MAG: hypothetical protein ACFFBP_01500 [Promethearchaeota archaeon]